MFELQYSRAAALLIAAMALATLGVVAVTPMPVAAALLLGTATACAALEAIHRVALHRGARGVRSIAVSRDGAVEVEDGLGARRQGRLSAGCFVAPWLTIVLWRAEGERGDRAVVIVPGMAPGEALRRLRVLLRWRGGDYSA